jgi:hypothetical protein
MIAQVRGGALVQAAVSIVVAGCVTGGSVDATVVSVGPVATD